MNDNTIYIGLCMAGAVSAGAYTAGVMDFLIEALDDWQRRKDAGDIGVPTHDVMIPVMGGASAGGMTTVITASAINNPIQPVKELEGDIFESQPENKFYNSWVDLTDDDMFPLMLDNDDIGDEGVPSLLNSSFIDKIADRVVQIDEDNLISRPYFSKNLKVFLTLSNLEGYSYNLAFVSGSKNDSYIMKKHRDYACFLFNCDENADDPENRGWIPISFEEGDNLEMLKAATMATGAFPVGLKSRRINRAKMDVLENRWITPSNMKPAWRTDGDEYEASFVDGGMINNEPFEKVGEVLDKITGNDEDSMSSFNRTMIMIDPFPSEETLFKRKEDVISIAMQTFSAMQNQVRMKPDEVVRAFDPTDASRFLIGPKRYFPNLDSQNEFEQGGNALACGTFRAFGGFFHKEFRIHDFFLGRANCERFLRYHFTVPADENNPVLDKGYEGLKDDFMTDDKRLPIIPLFSSEGEKPYMPTFQSGRDWPVRKEEDIDRFKKPLKKRVKAVRKSIFDDSFLINTGMGLFGDRKTADKILDSIKTDLKEHRSLL
ncbi:MAG: patatin-like phospholipase family protein [Balneolaceae bacterium]|nr:patatin-like phospholipase family protein [Balneolaceae bacterium]